MRPCAKDSAAKTLDFQVCHNYLVTLFMMNCKCLFLLPQNTEGADGKTINPDNNLFFLDKLS